MAAGLCGCDPVRLCSACCCIALRRLQAQLQDWHTVVASAAPICPLTCSIACLCLQMVEGLKVQTDKKAAAEQIKGLYRLFVEKDCTMVEVRADGGLLLEPRAAGN